MTVHDSLNGVTQTIPRGPAGFMGTIMQIGTNGGGFFDVDLAHPFENPTALTNFVYIWLTLSIPFSLTYTFGKMVKSIRHGVVLLGVMLIIFGSWVAFTSYSEHQNNPAVAAAGVHSTIGNTEGKEVRFGDTTSALFNVSMTQTSDGAVDSATDSYNPMGGFGPLTGMMLGEVTPGGVGSGLYTLLIYALIAVFLGGLMIGRTPEYLGKKIQAKEVKLAGLGALVMPIIVLVLTGIAVSLHAGRAGPLNHGPHGFTEILYGLTSQANNNGSAMAGLSGNTTFYNVIGAIDMLIGRFGIIIPALALAGSLAAKKVVPVSLGTFRTDNTMFIGLVIGVILIIGGLTFFPAVVARPDRRAAEPREVLLMTSPETEPMQVNETTPTPTPGASAPDGSRCGPGTQPLRPGDPRPGLDRLAQEVRSEDAVQEPGDVRGADRGDRGAPRGDRSSGHLHDAASPSGSSSRSRSPTLPRRWPRGGARRKPTR